MITGNSTSSSTAEVASTLSVFPTTILEVGSFRLADLPGKTSNSLSEVSMIFSGISNISAALADAAAFSRLYFPNKFISYEILSK